jgi:hypothetical protein
MMSRPSLRIYAVTALLSVAVASYVLFVRPRLPPDPPSQPPDLFTAACMWSMYPAFRVTFSLLPEKYSSMCCEDIDARDRIAFPLLFATNALFWTAMSAIVVFGVHCIRGRAYRKRII